MIRRIRTYLYLVAAICTVIAIITTSHINGWRLASALSHLGISLTYVWPEIMRSLHHSHR